MSSFELKKYLQILNESESYHSLNDAGPDYSPGNTEIWYWKNEYGRDFMMGYKWITEHDIPFDVNNLTLTHALIGKIAETDPETIFSLMQGESWSPQGQARGLLQSLDVGHTTMSTGDIIRLEKNLLMVDRMGFVNLANGENIS